MDIDPGKASFKKCIHAAREMYRVLKKCGVKSVCKTSGKTGLHVYVPLRRRYGFAEVRRFAKLLAKVIQERLPEIATLEQRINKRGKRVYLDVGRNAFTQTAVAPYSLRATIEATVSTPLEWNEVKKGLDPKKFTMQTIFRRIQKKGDLWKPVFGKAADLKRALAMLRAIEKLTSSSHP